MSVRLKDIPAEAPPASLPNPFIWITLLILMVLIYAAIMLFSWPEGKAAEGIDFWFSLLGPAFIAWLGLLSIRIIFLLSIQRLNDNFNQRRHVYIQQEIERGRRFLYILQQLAITTLPVQTLSTALLTGEAVLSARETTSGKVIRHTVISRTADITESVFVSRLLSQILSQMRDSIDALPKDYDIHLSLQADVRLSAEELEQVWLDSGLAEQFSHRIILNLERNKLAVLDDWLDKHSDKPAALLVIAVQLTSASDPKEESAEAVTAILFSNEYVSDLSSTVIHRPEQSDINNDFETALTQALQWSLIEDMKSINNLWVSGMDRSGLEVSLWMCELESEEFKALQAVKRYDIDKFLGHAGLAAPWLSVIAAGEQALETQCPQLILTDFEGNAQQSLWIGMVSPTKRQHL